MLEKSTFKYIWYLNVDYESYILFINFYSTYGIYITMKVKLCWNIDDCIILNRFLQLIQIILFDYYYYYHLLFKWHVLF